MDGEGEGQGECRGVGVLGGLILMPELWDLREGQTHSWCLAHEDNPLSHLCCCCHKKKIKCRWKPVKAKPSKDSLMVLRLCLECMQMKNNVNGKCGYCEGKKKK